jgi:hypothetical protein
MTCSIYCDSGRQPCPTPRNCGDGCHFNNATLHSSQLITDNSDSSNPGYPFELLDEGSRWKRLVLAVAAVLACMLVAAVVVPK